MPMLPRLLLLSILSCTALSSGPAAAATDVILPDQKPEPVKEQADKDQADKDREEVLRWAEKRALDIMTFNFNDYGGRRDYNRQYFTAHGFKEFYDAMENSGIHTAVVQNQYVTTSVVTCPPALMEEGISSKGPRWIIQVPMIVTYTNETRKSENGMYATIIVRTNNEYQGQYLGIEQWSSVKADPKQMPKCNPANSPLVQLEALQKRADALQAQLDKDEKQMKELRKSLKPAGRAPSGTDGFLPETSVPSLNPALMPGQTLSPQQQQQIQQQQLQQMGH